MSNELRLVQVSGDDTPSYLIQFTNDGRTAIVARQDGVLRPVAVEAVRLLNLPQPKPADKRETKGR